MRILVDLDGIVVDLLGPWIREYNALYGDNLTLDQVDSWHLDECVKCTKEEMLAIIQRPGYFDSLPPLPGAVAGVRALIAMGHDVKIATAPCGADSARAKLAWIERYFPGTGSFLCNDKHWIKADLIIDDKPETLEAFNGFTATIEYPYNSHLPVSCLAADCMDTAAAWREIVRFVKQLDGVTSIRSV